MSHAMSHAAAAAIAGPVSHRRLRSPRLGWGKTSQRRGRGPLHQGRIGLHQGRVGLRVEAVSDEVETTTHTVPSGLKLEVLSRRASRDTPSGGDKPPMVFVHGSYHAAWCWSEHFFEFFAGKGYDCFAVSMRGQGGSDAPVDGGIPTLEDHAEDITHFCEALASTHDRPPVLVGHSFGGLVAQFVTCQPSPPPLSGLVLLASVPPSGNGEMVKRFLKRDLWASVKITYAFIAGAFKTNAKLCRECFFSDDLPESTLVRHMGRIATSSQVRLLDLKALNASLPIPPPKPGSPPVCVVGGEDDFVVDVEGLRETAVWAGNTSPVVLTATAHDAMLDTRWQGTASALEGWMAAAGL